MTEIKKNPIPEDKSKDAKAAELSDEALEQVAGGGRENTADIPIVKQCDGEIKI